MHFVFALLFLISIVTTIEWTYVKAKKAVRWTIHPNRWDTFTMIEISHKERKLRRELSTQETKIVIEKWFKRFRRLTRITNSRSARL